MEKRTIRIRKVGSVTFGVVLIVTGILFLMQLFFPGLEYTTIVRLWPMILVLLGIEVLAGCRHKAYEIVDEKGRLVEQQKTVYDGAAILLTIVLTGFAICMAVLDMAIRYHMY